MTTEEFRHPEYFTPFKKWIHWHPRLKSRVAELDTPDIDNVIHYFGDTEYTYIMLLEQKPWGVGRHFSQKDTQNIINQMLRHSQGKLVKTARGQKKVKYCGYHVINLSGSTPNDSEILWDGEKITEDELVEILRFERDPDNLNRLPERGKFPNQEEPSPITTEGKQLSLEETQEEELPADF